MSVTVWPASRGVTCPFLSCCRQDNTGRGEEGQCLCGRGNVQPQCTSMEWAWRGSLGNRAAGPASVPPPGGLSVPWGRAGRVRASRGSSWDERGRGCDADGSVPRVYGPRSRWSHRALLWHFRTLWPTSVSCFLYLKKVINK